MPRCSNQDKAKSLGFFLQCNPETESLYVSFILFELMALCDLILHDLSSVLIAVVFMDVAVNKE